MATHECSGCLSKTKSGLVNEEDGLVIPASACSAPGGRHTWVPILTTATTGDICPSVEIPQPLLSANKKHRRYGSRYYYNFLL